MYFTITDQKDFFFLMVKGQHQTNWTDQNENGLLEMVQGSTRTSNMEVTSIFQVVTFIRIQVCMDYGYNSMITI